MDTRTDRTPEAGAETIRVLHVDDDPAFGRLTARLLQREDDRLDVTAVTDVDTGLRVFDSEPVDCVVSDYDMPERDGLSFLTALRERDEEIPFVLFTGQGDEAVASEALSAGVTDYLKKETGTDQYVILANRITNAVAADRTRRRAARQEHINTLLREVNRRLVDAVTVEEIEQAVCEVLAEPESYRFAWIGEPDLETGVVVPRAVAGDSADYLREVTVYHDDRRRGWGPTGMAVRTREIQLVQNVPEDPSFDPWRETVSAHGFGSVVVLPLCRGDTLHGVLGIYADEVNAFTEVERAVFGELVETVGRALETVHVRRRLRTRERADADVTARHYRAIAEGLPNGAIALFDTDMRYTVVGGSVFEDLDLSPMELEGTPLREAHSGSFRERHLHHYRAALAGEHRSFEFEYADRVFQAHVVPVRDTAGNVAAGLALTQDVTEERARERALERQNERLETFTGVVAHDLRNPLNVAAGRLDMALQECDSEHLEAVARAHDRMGSLIGDLLSLAREARTVTDTEPVDLAGTMTDAWRNVDTGRSNLVIATSRILRGDRTRLQQLLENLVRNAVEHGSTGNRGLSGDESDRDTPDVTVTLDTFEDGFYVEDDGPGIPTERREVVFEAGHSTALDGTGFGLNIVERIAEAHGWSVSATEGTDGGARFEVTGVEFER